MAQTLGTAKYWGYDYKVVKTKNPVTKTERLVAYDASGKPVAIMDVGDKDFRDVKTGEPIIGTGEALEEQLGDVRPKKYQGKGGLAGGGGGGGSFNIPTNVYPHSEWERMQQSAAFTGLPEWAKQYWTQLFEAMLPAASQYMDILQNIYQSLPQYIPPVDQLQAISQMGYSDALSNLIDRALIAANLRNVGRLAQVYTPALQTMTSLMPQARVSAQVSRGEGRGSEANPLAPYQLFAQYVLPWTVTGLGRIYPSTGLQGNYVFGGTDIFGGLPPMQL